MYLVTGATGNVGRHLVAELVVAGVKVRATSRRPESAGLPPEVEVVATEPGRFPLDGVTAVFANPAAVEEELGALLAQAAQHDVRKVVLLSTAAALDETNPIGAHHRQLEDQVRESGLPWTLLRPGVFNSNALMWAEAIRGEGVVRAPYASARIAPIDERDVAAVAARALLPRSGSAGQDADLTGASPVLTGPELLTQADQVARIARAAGVRATYEEITPEAAREGLVSAGLPGRVADGLLGYYAQAGDRPLHPTPAVTEATGRAPRTFAAWAEEHAEAFR
ncbi:NAD(P)H-binding protein [Streptomyces sp. NPDC002851]